MLHTHLPTSGGCQAPAPVTSRPCTSLRQARWRRQQCYAADVVKPALRLVVAGAAAAVGPATLQEPLSPQGPPQPAPSRPPLGPGRAGPTPPLSCAQRNGMYDSEGRLILKNLTLTEMEEWMVTVGEAPRRARQLYRALYGTHFWVRHLDEADGDSAIAFSAAFKAKVAAGASLSGGLQLQSVHTARDGTHKLQFQLVSDEGTASGSVETVLIPMTDRSGGNRRYTVCLSTQVGCAMNCQFCFTGRMGLLGNLSTAQVVEQVVAARRWLAEQAALADQQQTGHAAPAGPRREGAGLARWQVAAAAAAARREKGGPAVSLAAAAAGGQQAEGSTQQGGQQAEGSAQQGGQEDGWRDAGTEEVQEEEEGLAGGALSLLAQDPQPASSSSSSSGGVSELDLEWQGTRMPWGEFRPIPIANVVFMGMGEPFHNYDVVMATVDVLADGLGLSRNKIVVSTVGLADRMREFLAAGRAKLALSLHATTDEVPTNRRHPISELMSVLREHFPVGAKGDKFVVLEYVLLAGVNDTEADAHRLVALTQDIYCMINLIVFNPHEGTPFKKSKDEAVQAFRSILIAAGRVCTLRMSKGDDEMAACGQLGDPGQARKPVPVAAPPAALRDLLAGASAMQAANSAAAAAPGAAGGQGMTPVAGCS